MSVHQEPFFRYWRFRFESNYGNADVRVDGLHMYGRAGAVLDILDTAVDVFYNAGVYDAGAFVAPIAADPYIGFELDHGVVPRQIEIDYTAPGGGYSRDPWAIYTVPGTLRLWTCIVYAESLNLYVALSSDGYRTTSTDGITWTNDVAMPQLNIFKAVTWSPTLNLLVAVSQNGTNRVFTSPDGTTWTARTAPEVNQWTGVAWSPDLGLFAACAQSGTNRIMTSPDGINWTSRAASSSRPYRSIIWTGVPHSRFVATGQGVIAYSTNGTTWTQVNIGVNAYTYEDLAYSNSLGRIVAVSTNVGATTNQIITSDDGGLTWTGRTLALTSTGMHSVEYSPQLDKFFCNVTVAGNSYIYESTDGAAWTLSLTNVVPPESFIWSSQQLKLVGIGALNGNPDNVFVLQAHVIPGGPTDAPKNFVLEASHDKREWFEIKDFTYVI
jgi:hypothetical protein